MSGFVVACGEPRLEEVQRMFAKIGHRGPYASGIWEKQRVMMAQNYLRADIGGDQAQPAQVPVGTAGDDELRICYDGQIGKRPQVAHAGGFQGGPFQEERLLLHLYERYGSSMVGYLDDAVFAFVISDGQQIFAARDLLGIKTLFFGWKDGTLYLASELKCLVEVTDDVHEFPPGHTMDSRGRVIRFAALPGAPPETLHIDSDHSELIVDLDQVLEVLPEAQSRYPMVRTKEELSYFRLFTKHFGAGKAVQTVGQWISV